MKCTTKEVNSVHLKMIIPQNFRRTLKSYLTTLQDSFEKHGGNVSLSIKRRKKTTKRSMFSVAFLRLFLVSSLLAYFILLLTYLLILTYLLTHSGGRQSKVANCKEVFERGS